MCYHPMICTLSLKNVFIPYCFTTSHNQVQRNCQIITKHYHPDNHSTLKPKLYTWLERSNVWYPAQDTRHMKRHDWDSIPPTVVLIQHITKQVWCTFSG